MKIGILLKYFLALSLFVINLAICMILLTPRIDISFTQLATLKINGANPLALILLLTYWYFKTKYNAFEKIFTKPLILLLIGSTIVSLNSLIVFFLEIKFLLPLITKNTLFADLLFAQLYLLFNTVQIIHPFVAVRAAQTLKARLK